MGPVADEGAVPLHQVEADLVGLAGNLAAGTCRFLGLLAEFDTRRGWAGPGLRSCAHWLGWRIGMDRRTAREQLRVAHALSRLPATAAEFAAGRLSYSTVRALSRVATPETEQQWLTVARHGTAHHLDSLVRAVRTATDPRPPHARRGLHYSGNDDGSITVRVRLPAACAHRLLTAVDAALDTPTGHGGDHPPPGTDTGAATGGGGSAEPPTGHDTDHADRADTAEPADNSLYLGRRRRTVTPAQLCALRVRDREQCVVPGCHTTCGLAAHHLHWWRHGGRTDLDNLALVCGHHHVLIHDRGYHLTPAPHDRWHFTRPDGATVAATGAPTTGTVDNLTDPAIDDRTITPDWGGEPRDIDHALTALHPELLTEPVAA